MVFGNGSRAPGSLEVLWSAYVTGAGKPPGPRWLVESSRMYSRESAALGLGINGRGRGASLLRVQGAFFEPGLADRELWR
jgi:hypothetical protein